MMTVKFGWCIRGVAFMCVVIVAALGSGCCSTLCPNYCGNGCGTAMEADHWLMIYDKLEYDGTANECKVESTPNDLDYLPKCLSVEYGDTIGFANNAKEAITIDHSNALNGPMPITVPAGEKAVFKVVVHDKLIPFLIKTDSSHGGPDMIVAP